MFLKSKNVKEVPHLAEHYLHEYDLKKGWLTIRVQAKNENFSTPTFPKWFDPRIDLAPFFRPPDIVFACPPGLLCGPSGRP